jgi:hypothetical protein
VLIQTGACALFSSISVHSCIYAGALATSGLGVLSWGSRIREIYFGIPQISVQSIDRKISIGKLETRVGQSL